MSKMITKSKLREIIREELEEVKKKRPLTRREEREKKFPGWSELASLSSGIAEAPKKNCSPGNPIHLKSGEFGAASDGPGSWSINKDGPHRADCKSGQARRPSANKKTVWTKIKCGRGKDGKSKAPYRCFDGAKISDLDEALADNDGSPIHFETPEELKLWFSQQVDQLIAKADDDLVEKSRLLGEDDKAERVKAHCSRMGLKSLRDFLAIQNNFVRSASGDLMKSEK